MALLVTACLGMAGNCVSGIGSRMLRSGSPSSGRPVGMDDEVYESYQRGQSAGLFIDCCIFTFPVLFVYPLVLYGALRMQVAKDYWLAVTASVLAMLPCSLAFLIGFPAGIWAMVVLLNSDVKAAFHGPTE